MLALLREGEGIAAGVLASLGVNLGTVRQRVIPVVGASGAGPAEADEGTEMRQLIRVLIERLRAGAALAADTETRLLAGNLHAALGRWLARKGDGGE